MVHTIKDINAQQILKSLLSLLLGIWRFLLGMRRMKLQHNNLLLRLLPLSEREMRLPQSMIVPLSLRLQEFAAAPTNSSRTDEELREVFEAIEQEKEQQEEEDVPSKEKNKESEEEEEIHAEVIAKSIALAEPTSSELALFDDEEAEHFAEAQMPMEQSKLSILEPKEHADLLVAASKPEVEASAAVPRFVMPIHSLPASSATASYADPELAEFEVMDLDSQLDKLEKLSSTPWKAKSKAVEEAMERLKI
ncbi:unnamed protein product [Prunus armeniaca]